MYVITCVRTKTHEMHFSHTVSHVEKESIIDKMIRTKQKIGIFVVISLMSGIK